MGCVLQSSVFLDEVFKFDQKGTGKRGNENRRRSIELLFRAWVEYRDGESEVVDE